MLCTDLNWSFMEFVQCAAVGLGGIQDTAGEGGGFFLRLCGCGLGGGIEGLFDEPEAATEDYEDEEKRGLAKKESLTMLV